MTFEANRAPQGALPLKETNMSSKLRLNILSAQEVREIQDTNADDLMDYYGDIAERRKFSTTWSMYEVGRRMFRSAIVNPNGNPIIVAYDGGWGTGGQVILSHSPVWVTVWRACNQLITQSGDSHHVFIEGFNVKGNTLHLQTGS